MTQRKKVFMLSFTVMFLLSEISYFWKGGYNLSLYFQYINSEVIYDHLFIVLLSLMTSYMISKKFKKEVIIISE